MNLNRSAWRLNLNILECLRMKMVLDLANGTSNQVKVDRFGDLYNDNAI